MEWSCRQGADCGILAGVQSLSFPCWRSVRRWRSMAGASPGAMQFGWCRFPSPAEIRIRWIHIWEQARSFPESLFRPSSCRKHSYFQALITTQRSRIGRTTSQGGCARLFHLQQAVGSCSCLPQHVSRAQVGGTPPLRSRQITGLRNVASLSLPEPRKVNSPAAASREPGQGVAAVAKSGDGCMYAGDYAQPAVFPELNQCGYLRHGN